VISMISPPDVTSSRPATAVARLPFVWPEPCVAVGLTPFSVPGAMRV
jgi:hypothetical protein